ncbi:MAG TPA: co-chaperone DjlA [Wenzhouxiangella sp.]|nr:co-chaperone DjlA [Wenzhouxiangella sp.]
MGNFIFIGALAGLFLGGPFGLLVGAFVGAWVGRRALRSWRGTDAVAQQFILSTFTVMGALCKADGRVSEEEIRTAESFFRKFELSPAQRREAQAAFNRGKRLGFDLDAEVATLRHIVRGNQALLQLFVQVQLSAISADGVIHPSERNMLLRVVRGLRLSAADLRRIEAILRSATAAGGQTYQNQRRARSGAGARQRGQRSRPRPRPSSLDDAYATLGVEPSASDAEVKKSYRRMMSRYHPDKMAARGLPESMREVARERTLAIRKAYDDIRASRAG